MEVQEQIGKFAEFIESFCKKQLVERIKKDEKYLLLDFSELIKFEPELAEMTLESPDELIKAAEIAIEQFDMLGDVKNFKARFVNLSASHKLMIRNIRAKHLDKLLMIEGTVRQKSDVRPQVISARFECPTDNTIINVLQLDNKFREPQRCHTCGRKGKFILLSKEMVDAQGIVLEESSEDLEGGEQPKRINVLLKNDLVSPITEKKTNPGSKIRCVGVLKEVPILAKDGGKLTRFDLMIEVNSVESIEEDFSNIEISPEEEAEIIKLAQDPKLSEKLMRSIVPSIYGHETIKEAILMQMVGGVRKVRDDGSITRGDMHILLIGDPGAGKCLHPDTNILLADGNIEKISCFVEKNITCEEADLNTEMMLPTCYFNGQIREGNIPRVWKRKNKEKLLRVTTRTGKNIRLTKDHPLFYIEEGHIIAKEAKNFQVGERIATPRCIKINGSVQTINGFEPSYTNNSQKLVFPEVIDEKIARLLGYLCGEGDVAYTKTSGWVNFSNQDDDLLKDFNKTIILLFNAKTIIREPHKGKSCKEIYIYSKSLVDYFNLFFKGIARKSSEKSIPGLILKSDNGVLREFLKGLFECEAYVNVKKRQIEFLTTSKDLAEKLQICLLRYGIVSLFKTKIKCATNTVARKMPSYEIIISGNFVNEYSDKIGFISRKKKLELKRLLGLQTVFNTNVDLIPGVNRILKLLRIKANLSQEEIGIKRSSYCHYEQDNRLPSRDMLNKIIGQIDFECVEMGLLRTIAKSDLFFDEIIKIEEVDEVCEFVYDLEVSSTHNYMANAIMVHNSQILKRVGKIAPKGRFVSGKGASGAGLCVAPNSIILTNPGGMQSIESVVEERMHGSEKEYCKGVWREDNVKDIKIQSMCHDLHIQSKKPSAIWRLKAPNNVYSVLLSSGKKIELTANTQLFTIINGETCWKKSSMVKVGDYVATPRKLIGGQIRKIYSVDLIKSNPVMHGIKPFVKELCYSLSEKYGSIRNAARALKINENNLYHNWVNRKARGNIKLNELKKIADAVNSNWKDKVSQVSLYNGKKHRIPQKIDEEFLYVAGLIAGDGDIKKSGNIYIVRFSNSDPVLLNIYEEFLKKYSFRYDIQPSCEKRASAIKTHSKILYELFSAMCIFPSSKSHRIILTNNFMHLDNNLISSFLSGLYDSGSSINLRKAKGSGSVGLSTCSENLARQIIYLLLRYEIHAKLRMMPPPIGKRTGKHNKYVIEVRGQDNLIRFDKEFRLKSKHKIKALTTIISKKLKSNTDIDIIPGLSITKAGNIIKEEGSIISRQMLQSTVKNNKNCIYWSKLAFADIFWEKIVNVEKIIPEYGFVYDLTVEDSHNFVVDGVLVHNTAAVVKDEFMSGWSLEAGALVLGNKGVVCIDELDKMSEDDRDAMHEALEGQSYHYDTEVMDAYGRVKKIGAIVEGALQKPGRNKVKGHKCEFMFDEELSLLTTDFRKISRKKISRLSCHDPVEYYVEINYSNGRKILVTPEHPIFIYDKKGIVTAPATQVKKGMLCPAPNRLNTKTKRGTLVLPKTDNKNEKQVRFPKYMTNDLARLLGYIATEGQSYNSKKHMYAEIAISNCDTAIIDECKKLFQTIFNTTTNINKRDANRNKKATQYLFTVKCCSKSLFRFFELNFFELLNKAPNKRIPNILRAEDNTRKIAFLKAAFLGDGFFSNDLFGFSTASYGLAKDYQDLLLMQGIFSIISEEKRKDKSYYKVKICGKESLERFFVLIVDKKDKRALRIKKVILTNKNKSSTSDVLPLQVVKKLDKIIKELRMSTSYFNNHIKDNRNVSWIVFEKYLIKIKRRINVIRLEKDSEKKRKLCGITLKEVGKELGIKENQCGQYTKTNFSKWKGLVERMVKKKLNELTIDFNELDCLTKGDLRFITIKNVRKIRKDGQGVYDLTILPNHNFISEGVVLHNTVTISKANIQATMRAEATVLAAANPKFGRFDPYEIIPKQIDLPSTLINRFDLIFPVRDLPSKDKDEKLASFVLNLHQTPGIIDPDIDSGMLRKYLAYAKQKRFPKLSDGAIEEIKKYYLKMRGSGGDEGQNKSIPISARQLEGLIRMAEAVAKLRLGTIVEKKDAIKAIELMHYCLVQVGLDPETGQIDIDRISSGITASERGHISVVKEIINELEKKVGKTIPMDDIKDYANQKDIDEDSLDEIIQKLKRSGDIFEPKRGSISKL